MKKIFLSLALLTVFCNCAIAQKKGQQRIDSLLLRLPQIPEDTNKVKILKDLAITYAYINPDEGLIYGKQAAVLAQQLSWTRGIADSYAAIGSNYANKSDYANALDNEYKALKLYEQLNDALRQAVLLRNIAIVHHRSKNQSKALEYNTQSLKIYETLKNTEGIAAIYSNMANVYYSMKDKEKVLDYNLKALHLYEGMKNIQGTARLLGNIANFYAEQGEFSKAMVYYFDALRKETMMGSKDGVTRNLGNIGQTYLDIAKDTTGKIKPDSLIPLGRAANLKKAVAYLKIAITNAREINQSEYILAFGEVLSEAYNLSGNEKEALKIYKEYIVLRDSIYNVEKTNAAMRREMDYEYGKREDSINFQKQLAEVMLMDEQKSRNIEKKFYICGIVLVFIFSGFMFNRWRVSQYQKIIIEKEKKRSDELLLNILPAETAEELKATGAAKAKDFDEVTVMFTDFKNFTAISEKLNAQELVNEINYYYSAFDNIISNYRLEKIKTIGDSYMCAGGLPLPNKTNAEDTVRAALDILNFISDEKQRRSQEERIFFEIRIGIHTGPIVAGIVGIKKFAYDIWGDTVNVAARIESSGEVGKVNISGTTYELVKALFTCRYRGKIEAKNKGEIDMYFVEG